MKQEIFSNTDEPQKSYGARMIDSFELADRLREFARLGVDVPHLEKSNFTVRYIGNENGVELYSHAGRTLRVAHWQRIDSHGNVVDFDALRLRALFGADSDPNPNINPLQTPDINFSLNAWKSKYASKKDNP